MDIIVYVKTGCGWCQSVTEFLDASGIEYETRNVLENPAFMQELIALSGQDKTPTLDLEGEILANTDKEAVEAFLKEKGVL